MSNDGAHRFRPRLWPTLGTLVGLSILIALGSWQTMRYFEKLELEAQRAARLDDEPIRVDSFEEFKARAQAYSPIEVRGHLDPNYVFLFKHRTHNGRPGYWLGGVLRFAQGPGALLVNRGWVARDEALALAAKPPESGTEIYSGLVYQPERVIADEGTRANLKSGQITLKTSADAEPVEWETYDIVGIANALPMPTPSTPTIIVLGPEHSGHPYPVASLDYITKPYLTSERHLSYAIFWFSTAIALLAMYLANALGYLGSGRHRPAPR
jgi:cytochrome oxidase assembly protein ShyY1